MIAALFPRDVVALSSAGGPSSFSLLPEEEVSIRGAAEKRKREFTLGRGLAREALAQLGVSDFPILRGTAREPLWPPAFTGSISHCSNLCGVAVARAGTITGLGLDLEVASPLPGEIAPRVCTESEMRWMETAPLPPAADWAMFFFCAKESIFKAVFPETRVQLDFLDVEVSFLPDKRRFIPHFSQEEVASWARGRTVLGRFAFNLTHVGTGLTVFGPGTRVSQGSETLPEADPLSHGSQGAAQVRAL